MPLDKTLKRGASSSSTKLKSSKVSKSAEEPLHNAPKSVKPFLSVTKPPLFNLKGKGKECDVQLPKSKRDTQPNDENEKMWVDRYEPKSEAELAVHKRKVEGVRRWLQEALEDERLRKYRRILTLTGPAGTGKTATLRVLAEEMSLELVEWRNSVDDRFAGDWDDYERESLTQKFATFLARAGSCRPLLSTSQAASASASTSVTALSPSLPKRPVILLEDLPNILHPGTQTAFHTALNDFLASSPSAPLVIIVSDSGMRGEARDEYVAQSGSWGGRDIVDVRSIIPPDLLGGPYVTQIAFNPIAPTLMHRALQALLTPHSNSKAGVSTATPAKHPSKDTLDIIVSSSNGDIRSAIMALQFACTIELADSNTKRAAKGKKNKNVPARKILEAVSRREQSLALFHLLGKVLYNKRKDDPPIPSATAKDIQRERELDALIPEPPSLPEWHASHARRGSRVDIDTLYKDSPVDSSLFALYVHQNYTSFCEEVEECGGVCDWLSWVDASGGQHWHQANPHQFHLLAMGTLHSLPSPVARRSQKMFKPEFFDALKRSHEADDAIADVREWMQNLFIASDGVTYESISTGGWSKDEVVRELGAILRVRSHGDTPAPPPSHRDFSALAFASHVGGGTPLAEDDDNAADEPTQDTMFSANLMDHKTKPHQRDVYLGVGWLSDDEIEEFD
ncbi:P-loop containing nucleoside triphosphate hydrolase protein [Rickenella mellea]|uniref:P-loop containing nucleoside triphosphate hydrolase protein n=1 Tax=Rickenella mellea TaxID=50990 RepID=A0A4Y7QLF9_9AGAM|nr:P-loop containing nucleoside triphosphate hydrolase protein [Rickenella mellea]